MMKVKSLLVLSTLLMSNLVFAQSDDCEDGWCWGEDPGLTKEKYVLASDAIKMKDYQNAIEPMDWLLENTPNLNKAIYIHAVDLYEALEDKAATPEEKIVYQDKILEMYDVRIKYYGEEADVLERKGRKAYFYWKDRQDADKWQKMYDLYNRITELNKVGTSRSALVFLMLSMVNQSKRKKMTDEEVLNKYDEITDIIQQNVAGGKDAQKWVGTQDKIDGLLAKAVTIDCDFVREKMADDLKNKPEDMKNNKRAMKYMINGKCTDDPLFLVVSENIFAQEPAASLANIISKRYQKLEDLDKTMEWKNKAIELAEDNPALQAELLMDIAKILQVKGKRSDARSTAYKAIEKDNTVAPDAYTLIGDLYFSSGSLCQSQNRVKARAIYLAAYDMYQKAGNSSRMAKAREQFPSISEIFELNLKEGDSYEVGCWIGGTTTLRRRPSN